MRRYMWSPFGELRVLNDTAQRLLRRNDSATAAKLALRPTDAIVLNFGQHPASGAHWSAAAYTQQACAAWELPWRVVCRARVRDMHAALHSPRHLRATWRAC